MQIILQLQIRNTVCGLPEIGVDQQGFEHSELQPERVYFIVGCLGCLGMSFYWFLDYGVITDSSDLEHAGLS